ncbi:low affinity immunoglobulin gamma Fc region receptor III-A isoform X2 [Tachysurus fulvidraco]|uniref:low affinity immunoglobulin gamma Fc region receptor III-A isoform X2 n=1 Tax=Tachysurus fulvidraco TaxID=1234273 RepID=UPI001FEE572C|nr:low affinity immunoglobulin gamma Fc region receptor III-A isoform X2 [Tachysurus fulvidraco]
MNQRTFFLLVIMGFCAMWQKAVPVNGTHIISSPSSSEDFWEKDNLTLKCNIASGTYVSYEWFLNDSLIHNDSNVLHISSLSNKHNGKYVCVAKNYLNETFYYSSTSKERNVHVKEHLSKPEISIEVIKNTDGNISARVKCHVTKGSPPINFILFKNNHIVHAVTSPHMDALFTLPIALDQDMGTVYCQANNRKYPMHSRELNLKVVFNVIPTKVAAIVFTCFSLLICAVLACCIFGVVLRKKRARTYMFTLKDFTDMHSIVDDDHDDDKKMIEENIYEEKNDALDTGASIDDIFNTLEVLQASMMKDSDESEEEDTNLHYSF